MKHDLHNSAQLSLLDSSTDASLMHSILSMPKIDLHRHLTGSVTVDSAIKVAARYGLELPTYLSSELRALLCNQVKVSSLKEYFRPWPTVNALFSSRDATRDLVVDVIRNASEDNVIYLELRLSPQGFLGNAPFSFEQFAEAVSEAVTEADATLGITTKCILGIPRHLFGRIPRDVRNKMFARIVSIIASVRPQCFVGVDLNGDEMAEDGEKFKTFFKLAREKGFGITIHAGECGPSSNIEYALNKLSATRIGHGLASADDPGLLSALADSNCALEICPTSNELLGLISQTADLPIRKLREYRVPFAICTDNPTRCNTSLSEELFKVAKAFTLSITDLKQITMSSIEHSFAGPDTKGYLIKKVEPGSG